MKRRKTASADTIHENGPPEVRSQFRFKTQAQREAWDVISKNHITFLLGEAGVGKTQVAIAWAVQAVNRGEYEEIIQTRPAVEAGEMLGFLPGDINSKLMPYMTPLTKCGQKVPNQDTVNRETIPLAYMRGVTFENAVCILDESQNCTMGNLKLYISRMGEGSRLIIAGDTEQADIRDSGLAEVARELSGIPGIGVFHFRPEDTVRHPLLVQILKHPVWKKPDNRAHGRRRSPGGE
jgi:phosphate starvation-inducible PhoH-like protein